MLLDISKLTVSHKLNLIGVHKTPKDVLITIAKNSVIYHLKEKEVKIFFDSDLYRKVESFDFYNTVTPDTSADNLTFSLRLPTNMKRMLPRVVSSTEFKVLYDKDLKTLHSISTIYANILLVKSLNTLGDISMCEVYTVNDSIRTERTSTYVFLAKEKYPLTTTQELMDILGEPVDFIVKNSAKIVSALYLISFRTYYTMQDFKEVFDSSQIDY